MFLTTKPIHPSTSSAWLYIRLALTAAVLMPLLLTIACSVQEDKSGDNSKPEHVKISTPIGGLNVSSKDVDAAALGLPEYPGAHQLTKDEDNNNDGSVDLHMGFGPWQMRVKVISYGTPDPPDKVMAFYRTALAKYGDVIECDGHHAVGAPTVTKEGLGCDDSNSGSHAEWNAHSNVNISDSDLQLKAGSKRRQHIVGFKKTTGGETKFALIYLDLPSSSQEQTN